MDRLDDMEATMEKSNLQYSTLPATPDPDTASTDAVRIHRHVQLVYDCLLNILRMIFFRLHQS
jgi:hypothetical protein